MDISERPYRDKDEHYFVINTIVIKPLNSENWSRKPIKYLTGTTWPCCK